MHALTDMYIGYANGYFNQIFYGEDIKLPMALISASELAYGTGNISDYVSDAKPV